MEAMDNTASFMVDDDLLNFSLEEEDEDEEKLTFSTTTTNSSATTSGKTMLKEPFVSSSLGTSNPISLDPHDHSRSFPEFIEEDLEWLSNKDAFPSVETCFGILSDNPGLLFNHQSPVSVLENSSSCSNSSSNSNCNTKSNDSTIMSCFGNLKVPISYPVRPRSNRRRRRRRTCFPDMSVQQSSMLWNHVNVKSTRQEPTTIGGSSMGRRCQHCGADKTPQWRAGPMGPKTLCNACGVRYKSGRLLPEYRPASSPTFSSKLHSNSHRKVLEMRKVKQTRMGGVMVNEACGYSNLG